MCDIVRRAYKYAVMAHGDQTRKYTGEPYFHHPVSVVHILSDVTDDPEILAAAYLHDVVEDTEYTIWNIYNSFGQRVAEMVRDVTDVSKLSCGNRALRKKIDRYFLATASADAKTIKLADLIHNSYSIYMHDVDFSVVYFREIELLLPFLKTGNSELFEYLSCIVNSYNSTKIIIFINMGH